MNIFIDLRCNKFVEGGNKLTKLFWKFKTLQKYSQIYTFWQFSENERYIFLNQA